MAKQSGFSLPLLHEYSLQILDRVVQSARLLSSHREMDHGTRAEEIESLGIKLNVSSRHTFVSFFLFLASFLSEDEFKEDYFINEAKRSAFVHLFHIEDSLKVEVIYRHFEQ